VAQLFSTRPKPAQAVNYEVPAEPAVSEKPKRRWYQFSITELMILAAVVGAMIRWPVLIFVALPLALHWILRMLSCTQRLKFWLPALIVYLVLIPFSFGPVLKANMWFADNVLKEPRLHSLAAYRPIMRVVKRTPLWGPVWKWTEWINGHVGWDP
jgi:hypothetical protein